MQDATHRGFPALLQGDHQVPGSSPASAASRQAGFESASPLPSVGQASAEDLAAAETGPAQVSRLCCKKLSDPTQLQAASAS